MTIGRTDSEWNNYKEYDDEAIQRLAIIRICKDFGFTLNEISEILDLVDENNATCNTMSEMVKKKLSEIDQKLNALVQLRKVIKEKFETSNDVCKNNSERGCNCNVITVANNVYKQ